MKSLQSDLHRGARIHSLATISAFPSSAERGDEATTLLVINDDRMFSESEVQIRCDLGRRAKLGKAFTLEHLFHKVRRLLAHVAPLPMRKRLGSSL